MSIFRCPKTIPVPEPYTADEIKTESGICTGKRTIGFYDRSAKKACVLAATVTVNESSFEFSRSEST